ncbi:MAG: hypothetical protein ACREM3_27975 [Candidatus Rokuibacteriota bacterium]
MTRPDIISFVTDPQLLGLSLSPAQRTLLKAAYGLRLTGAEMEIYRGCTGRGYYCAGRPPSEITVIAGARAGKDSRCAAPIVVYESTFGGHERHLAKGERATVVLVAQDARATKIAFGYIRDYLTRSPLLAPLVADVLASEITLTSGVTVACFPSTIKSLRGWSIPVGVMDELAFFRLEGSANADTEIQQSIRRGMINFPATKLVKISTAYMRSGVLYEDFKRAFGQRDADLLVWRAPSLLMNPSLRAERLERERRLDPLRFAREYEAEFAEDLEAFLPAAWVDAAVVPGRHELPRREGVRYVAAVDPSGGGPDAFTLAVVHREGSGAEQRIVHDVMRGRGRVGGGPLDLEGVVREFAATVHAYGLSTVIGDRYAGAWVREAFARAGLRYDDATVRKNGEPVTLDKSTAYLEAEPLFAQGQIEVLDHPQLSRELKMLERRPRAGGRTTVDHPTGGHDDFANALCLAAAVAGQGRIAPIGGTLASLATLGAPVAGAQRVPAHIAQIGEPARPGNRLGSVATRPAAARIAGQAAWISRRYF